MADPEKKKGGRPARGAEPCNCPVSGRVTRTNLDYLDLEAIIRTRDTKTKVTRSQLLNEAVDMLREKSDAERAV